jgi:hypothetical protein
MSEEQQTNTEPNDVSAELEALRAELEQTKSTLKAYGEWTPAKIKELTSKKAPKELDVEAFKKEVETEISERFSSSLAEKEAALAEKESLLSNLQQELTGLRLDSSVLLKATEFVKPDAVALLKPTIQKDADFKDGKVIFKDEKGNPRYSKSNPKQYLSPDEYLTELVAKHPSLAIDNSKAGTGVRPSGGTTTSPGGISVEKYNAMTLEQRKALDPAVKQRLAFESLGLGKRANKALAAKQ